MALTTESFNANGSQRSFTVSSTILSESHIRIHFYYDELDHEVNSIYWDLLGNVILFKEAPTSGYVIKITVSSDGSGLDDSPSFIENVATYISDVITVSESINSVNSVSNNLNGTNEITTVANDLELGSNSEIRKVNNNSSNINTVANISNNVTIVANNTTNITTVANNNTNITAVANNNTNITTVANNATNINTVADNIGNVSIIGNDLSGEFSYIEDNGSITDIVESTSGTSHITTVANDIDSVVIVAENIDNITAILNMNVETGEAGTDAVWVPETGILTIPRGDQGDKGDKGDKGDTGAGIIVGGTANQVLAKNSSTDYDTKWLSVVPITGDFTLDLGSLT